MEKKLTPKQQLFVSEFLKTGNATEAARKAGYKGNEETLRSIGKENLTKPPIKRAIDEKNQKRNERLELEEDFELKKALKLLEMCMEPEKVYNPFSGEPVKDVDGNYVMKFDSKGANTALQTIAKLRGKFVQKLEVGMADNLFEDVAGVKDV
ncbi:MAG: terminase small subunit [Duodenibacillus sp.]|nr:terminase small subunit [Duodenibacillus sp.]